MPDKEDVVFAVYHAGGSTKGMDAMTVATSCNASVEDVDVPLAEAVEDGLLDRSQDNQTGRLVFSLTPAGIEFIEKHD